MEYGIWVKKEFFNVFEDGSKRRIDIIEGWNGDIPYVSMKVAKICLAAVKTMLKKDFYDVTKVNGVTVKGVRVGTYCETSVKLEEHVVYHIEER